ncbi:hypothetical protein HC776_02270, partial [bacterium]|nr:hypothetical protein [bacterium]
MLFRREMIAVPSIVTIRFELNPVSTLTNALIIAYNEQGWLDGADQTLRAFMENLSPEKRAIHNLVYGFFSSAIPHVGSMSFPDFLKDFATRDATQLRDHAIHWFPQVEGFPGFEAILNNRETFVEFVGQLATLKGFEHEDDEARRGYEYLIDPVRLKDMMLSHMTFVWNAVLQKEWRKHETSLRQCVETHQQHNYSTFHTSFEAVEAVTGRDMRNSEKDEICSGALSEPCLRPPPPYLG